VPLPYQGNNRTTSWDRLSPTLIPNFYGNSMSNAAGDAGNTLDAQSPAQYVANNARGTATSILTVGGAITSGGGDVVVLTLTQPQLAGGSFSLSYVSVASDTIAGVAEGLDSTFNAYVRANLSSGYGPTEIWADTEEGTLALEAKMVVNWIGPMGNFATLTATATGSLTVAVSSAALGGGSGPVLAANNFTFSYNGSTMAFYYGKPYNLDGVLLATLAAQDQPVI
jgi:hypothetical protein